MKPSVISFAMFNKWLVINTCKAVIIGLVLWCCMLFSGCYTKRSAIKNFGCDTTSVKIDTTKPALTRIDTFTKTVIIKGDTIYTQSPCEEIKTMKPGQSKTTKKGGTTQTYGKDSAGKDFFSSKCDSIKTVSNLYREYWFQTVNRTNFVQNKILEKTWIQKFTDGSLFFFQIVGILTMVLLVVFLVSKFAFPGRIMK